VSILIAIIVGVIFATSTFLMLGRELKGICMGVFLLGHGANLAILASSRSPVSTAQRDLFPPILTEGIPISEYVDPLPQALILTAIVIGFAVQAFLLTMLVITWRKAGTLELEPLAKAEEH